MKHYDKKEYTWLQRYQLNLGIKNKVDISFFSDKNLEWPQMEQMRLALMEGLDISMFTDELNANEMEQLRFKLHETGKVEATSPLIKTVLDHKNEKAILSSDEELKGELEILENIDPPEEMIIEKSVFNKGELETDTTKIILGDVTVEATSTIDEDEWVEDNKNEEICGEHELEDVEIIETVYVPEELIIEVVNQQEITTVAKEVEVESKDRITEVISEVAEVEVASTIEIIKLIQEKEIESDDNEIENKSKITGSVINEDKSIEIIKLNKVKNKNNKRLIIVVSMMIGICISGFVFYPTMLKYTEQMELVLKKDSIDLEINTPFVAGQYIESYTQNDNTHVLLPELNTSELGSYQISYEITNGTKAIKKNLLVNVVDTKSPEITLSKETIDINKTKDTFDCKIYIESAWDDADGDMLKDVKCSNALDISKSQQNVEYVVFDKSGNKGINYLIVNLKQTEEKNSNTVTKPKIKNESYPEINSGQPNGGWVEIIEESWSSEGSYEVNSDVTVDFQ